MKRHTGPTVEVTLSEAERMALADLKAIEAERVARRHRIIAKQQMAMRSVWWRRLFRVDVTWEAAAAEAGRSYSVAPDELTWADWTASKHSELSQSVISFVAAWRREHPNTDAYRETHSPEPTITMAIADYRVMSYRVEHTK